MDGGFTVCKIVISESKTSEYFTSNDSKDVNWFLNFFSESWGGM